MLICSPQFQESSRCRFLVAWHTISTSRIIEITFLFCYAFVHLVTKKIRKNWNIYNQKVRSIALEVKYAPIQTLIPFQKTLSRFYIAPRWFGIISSWSILQNWYDSIYSYYFIYTRIGFHKSYIKTNKNNAMKLHWSYNFNLGVLERWN